MKPGFSLSDHDVHVWRVDLDLPPERIEQHRATLASDEVQRAGRYHFERDRNRFIAARGWLRKLLADYSGAAPAEITFQYNPQGKPSLVATAGLPPFCFNVSHSGNLGIVAICLGHPIGVDIEYIKSGIEDELLAQRFFAPPEIRDYMSLPHTERLPAFYRCWTRKEAYVKARGDGLSLPFNRFAVTMLPSMSPRLIQHDLEPSEVERWTLMDLQIETAQVAVALAVEGDGWHVTIRRCSTGEAGYL